MDTSIYIPSQYKAKTVKEFYFRPGSKEVTVSMDFYGNIYLETVNIQPVLDIMTDPQKTIVKTFFKKVAGLALSVEDTSINGDPFS